MCDYTALNVEPNWIPCTDSLFFKTSCNSKKDCFPKWWNCGDFFFFQFRRKRKSIQKSVHVPRQNVTSMTVTVVEVHHKKKKKSNYSCHNPLRSSSSGEFVLNKTRRKDQRRRLLNFWAQSTNSELSLRRNRLAGLKSCDVGLRLYFLRGFWPFQ